MIREDGTQRSGLMCSEADSKRPKKQCFFADKGRLVLALKSLS